jgi:hypothetical protein
VATLDIADLKKAYDDLSQSLPKTIEKAQEIYEQNRAQNLDEMSELGEDGWIYPYFVFTHRIHGTKFVKLVQEYAKTCGFKMKVGAEFETDEHSVAYTSAVLWSRELPEAERQRILSETYDIALWRNGTKRLMHFLDITWRDRSFDAKLASWAEIEQFLRTLS